MFDEFCTLLNSALRVSKESASYNCINDLRLTEPMRLKKNLMKLSDNVYKLGKMWKFWMETIEMKFSLIWYPSINSKLGNIFVGHEHIAKALCSSERNTRLYQVSIPISLAFRGIPQSFQWNCLINKGKQVPKCFSNFQSIQMLRFWCVLLRLQMSDFVSIGRRYALIDLHWHVNHFWSSEVPVRSKAVQIE